MKKALILPLVLLACAIHAQDIIPISVKELAPDFGIRPQFLDDTIHVARYLDSLPDANPQLTDTCVTLNAKLMAMENVLLYDYRHANDTVWIDATHYLEDYTLYINKINTLSQFILRRAHNYIEQEHIRQDNSETAVLHLRKDTIDRYHRTILNACEGIGVTDKDRKKQLKDTYYAYLTVYNRYDFSMKRKDTSYTASLDQFCEFQQHLIYNILSTNNYNVRINNFINTLRARCGHNHTDVLRSYQRAFRQGIPPIQFTTIREYRAYIEQLQSIIDIQNSYLSAIDLREQIAATGKRINSLYYPKFSEAAKTYNEVAARLNTVPSFNTRHDAILFIHELEEFIRVQDCYVADYSRLMAIIEHGDTINKRCGLKYVDITRAYKQVSDINSTRPTYQSIDDAQRFAFHLDRFEYLQRQFDTIIAMRRQIDSTRECIAKGWMSHMNIYNGFQSIRKQFVLTPTFIDISGGQEFIAHLQDYLDMEGYCLHAISLYETYKQWGEKITPEIQPYRNIGKAYTMLEKEYITIKNINHLSDLLIYIRQLEAFITVQEHIHERLSGNGTTQLDERLHNQKDIARIEALLGL